MGTALVPYKSLVDGLYILSDKTPIPATDRDLWALWWHQPGNRILAQTNVAGSLVSTIFLGMDHSFGDGSDPILFETMVFGDRVDEISRRYRTWDDAMEGHEKIVKEIRRDEIKRIYSIQNVLAAIISAATIAYVLWTLLAK